MGPRRRRAGDGPRGKAAAPEPAVEVGEEFLLGKPYVAFAPNGPRDIFLAQGHEGQVVVVVPSKDLVLVRLGLFDDFVGWGPLGAWAVDIINLFPDIERN